MQTQSFNRNEVTTGCNSPPPVKPLKIHVMMTNKSNPNTLTTGWLKSNTTEHIASFIE